jgi:hypothetical protein
MEPSTRPSQTAGSAAGYAFYDLKGQLVADAPSGHEIYAVPQS